MGVRTRLARRIAPLTTNRRSRRVMKRIVPRLDAGVARLTGGRYRLTDAVLPTLVLHHTGRRSGRDRSVVLAAMPDGDGFVVIGSNWGQTTHPGWALNVTERPEVEMEVRGRRQPMTARRLTGAERDEAWTRMAALWPVYDRYMASAGGRELRVFRLEPAEDRRR
ncbi:MAG: nitroreductase family deazaflavin-dependent oxidoreductase [Acidimicrobiales bacterium]